MRARARRLGLARAARRRRRDAVALPSTAGGPTGQPGGNSAFRLAGVWERFSADGLDVPSGGVLLVDDQADSRWTLTVAARALRAAGATEVLPFVLALRG